MKPASQDSNQVVKSSLRGSMDMEGGGGFLVFSFFSVVCVFGFLLSLLSLLSLLFIKLSYWMYITAAQVRGAWDQLLGAGEGLEWRSCGAWNNGTVPTARS